jgi:5-formyltetrahydrofolate cyclo-ligase
MNKVKFRKHCIEKLKKESKQNQLYKKSMINKRLTNLLNKLKAKKILFYYPMDIEANILPTMYRFRKKSTIFVPFIKDISFKMVKFRLPIKKSRFKIVESFNSHYYKQNIDVAIVPVVGIDKSYQRVGFGRGMYDRFFETIDKPIIVFLQNSICYTNKSVCHHYDIRADFYITPRQTLKVTNDRTNNFLYRNCNF